MERLDESIKEEADGIHNSLGELVALLQELIVTGLLVFQTAGIVVTWKSFEVFVNFVRLYFMHCGK